MLTTIICQYTINNQYNMHKHYYIQTEQYHWIWNYLNNFKFTGTLNILIPIYNYIY